MFANFQWGLLAACVVLFVPMGMAGLHLSRNKMLFFSGALFITLAVGVHLTPYFPSFVDLVNSMQSVAFDAQDTFCLNFINEILWDVRPVLSDKEKDGGSSWTYEKIWSWTKTENVARCGFEKFGKLDAGELFNGSWVVVAGDSQARLLVQSLLSLLLDEERLSSTKTDLFKRHSDYETFIEETGLKLDFVWAPYVANLSDLVMGFHNNQSYPDVLVMGAALWHMLHVSDPSDYRHSLQDLKNDVVSLAFSQQPGAEGATTGSVSIRSPHLIWMNTPVLINSMLNNEEKKLKMNERLCHEYDKALQNSELLQKHGGPMFLLDVQSLTRNCGTHCTLDGMHYDEVVYEAAVHIILNTLLIESHQKLGTPES